MSSNYANNREAGFYKPEQHPDKLFEPDPFDDINHLIAQAVLAELDYLEQHGHGGGNWRRLIIERKARLEEK